MIFGINMNDQKNTVIIYLIGTPGTGKYTIAKEIEKSGYIVCDNQLINNPIFSLVGYDGFSTVPISAAAWNAIGRIRSVILDFISNEHTHNYIFTNVLYEDEGDRQCYNQLKEMAAKRNSIFVSVKLHISEEENIRRIEQPERELRYKSRDKQDVFTRMPLIHVEHENLYELDVTSLSAKEAAISILQHVSEQ